MKKLFSILFLLVLMLLSFAANAQTRLTPDLTTNLVTPAVITSTGYSNAVTGTFASQPVIINPGYGVGLTLKWTNAVAAATTNLGVYINVADANTNWCDVAPYYVEMKRTASQTYRVYTNLPASWFDGAAQMRIDGITNCDNANSVSNISVTLSRKRLDY